VIGIGSGDGLDVDEGVVESQRATVTEIAQRSIGRAESSAHHQRRPDLVREPDTRGVVVLWGETSARLALQEMLTLLRAATVLKIAARATWQPWGTFRRLRWARCRPRSDKVGLEAAGFGVGREEIPAQAEIQRQLGIHLPVVLEVDANVPAMVVGSSDIGGGEAVHAAYVIHS
jgi:hypothetical protein